MPDTYLDAECLSRILLADNGTIVVGLSDRDRTCTCVGPSSLAVLGAIELVGSGVNSIRRPPPLTIVDSGGGDCEVHGWMDDNAKNKLCYKQTQCGGSVYVQRQL